MVNTVRTVGSPTTPNDRGFPPTIWFQVDWKKAERRGQNLRSRIFRATKEQRWKHVRHLTKLLLCNYANVLVSLRRITQVNRGRHTPGIDGERVTTPDAHARLVDDLRQYQSWKAAPVRRSYISKANGKQRPLGMPAVLDRVCQQARVQRMEGIFEPTFLDSSVGYRPGRSAYEARRQVWQELNAGYGWIVAAALRQCLARAS